jgi:putative metalloprotease
MVKLTTIVLAVLYAVAIYMFSAWRMNRQLDAQSTELADAKLRNLTRRLAAEVDLPDLKVHVFEVEPVNGLAAPDGRIFITRGFYNRYVAGEVTAEELSSVIAHELGHVALGHSKRRLLDFSGQNAIRVALGGLLTRILPIPGLAFWLAGMAAGLLAARLSRQDEHEADAYASALLVKAGIGTGPQKSLFQKLDKMAPGGIGRPAWLLSHPKTAERIKAIEARETKWGLVPTR